MGQYEIPGLLNETAAETGHDEVAQHRVGKMGQSIVHSLGSDFAPVSLAPQSRDQFDYRQF